MINPCGYAELRVTRLADWVEKVRFQQVVVEMVSAFCRLLDYHEVDDIAACGEN